MANRTESMKPQNKIPRCIICQNGFCNISNVTTLQTMHGILCPWASCLLHCSMLIKMLYCNITSKWRLPFLSTFCISVLLIRTRFCEMHREVKCNTDSSVHVLTYISVFQSNLNGLKSLCLYTNAQRHLNSEISHGVNGAYKYLSFLFCHRKDKVSQMLAIQIDLTQTIQ